MKVWKEATFHIARLLVYYMLYQLLFTVVSMLGVFVVNLVIGGISSADVEAFLATSETNPDMTLLMGKTGAVWAMAIGLLLSSLMMLWHIVHFGYFKVGESPLRQVGRRTLLLCVLLVFSSMFMFNVCAQWANLPDNLSDQMQALSNNVFGVLAIAVFAPLLEEVLFRGAIQGYLMRRLKSPWLAILIASLIFGVIHMNPIQILYATLLGIVFGWIYYRTGSLVPVIIGHVLNNSLAAMAMIFAGGEEQEMELGLGNEIAIVVVAAIFSIILVNAINRVQPPVPQPWHAVDEEPADDNLSIEG